MKFIPMLSRFAPIGLDIGSCSIKAVQCRRVGGVLWPVAQARFARTDCGSSVEEAELEVIAGVLRRQGFVGRDFVIAASHEKLKIAPLELPAKGPKVPIHRLARAEFSRLHKCDLAESEFAYWETPASARAGKATHLMALAYPHVDSNQQIGMFESAGLRIRAIDTHGSSLARACLDLVEPGKASAILEVGWSSAVLVMIRNGVVAYERRIVDLALSKVHAELERSAELPFDESLGALFDPAAQRLPVVTDVLGSYFNAIAQELTKTIAYARHQYPESMVEQIFLVGGGADLTSIDDQIQSICGVETKRVQWSASAHGVVAPAMASALGLSKFAA